jgi:endonuclease-3
LDIELILNRLSSFVGENLPFGDRISLEKKEPFLILVATMLSARTRDETTEIVAEKLFKKISKPEDILKFSEEELSSMIKPVGFYRTKAKNLIKTSKILIKKYKGKVPVNFDELISLPGVGRKTANLVQILSFGIDTICVDTHVHRISNRIGFVKTKTPEQTESSLKKKIHKKWWKRINTILVVYGKKICLPIRPKCEECVIKDFCEFRINKI